MYKRKIFVYVAGLLALAMLLAACGPAPTPEVVTQVKEVEVTRVVAGTPEVVVVTATPEPAQPKEGPTAIVWWSHWANEPSKRVVIEKIRADYEAEHPDVKIVLTWWDKNPMRDALRNTMNAGEGAPDITSDFCLPDEVAAGWCLPLTDVLPWENFVPGTQEASSYAALGYPDNYKYDIGLSMNMIFYNKEIFEELGIQVPDNYQFTQDEWIEMSEKCSAAGYAGAADAIGNRNYPARFPVWFALFNLVGPEEFNKYYSGQQSWDTPQIRQVLDWFVQLRDAGFWPSTFSTMTIDEFHVYFHTQHKACTLWIPSWYTGRAFKPVEQGGQDPNWHFGMLRYPLMNGATAPDAIYVAYESGYHVTSATRHPDIAKDILVFASQPKYGALWTAVTNIPSAIVYDPVKDWPSDELLEELGVVPGQWQWYWEEYNKVYGGLQGGQAPTPLCDKVEQAWASAINEGLPLGLITVDEAIEMMDANLCK